MGSLAIADAASDDNSATINHQEHVSNGHHLRVPGIDSPVWIPNVARNSGPVFLKQTDASMHALILPNASPILCVYLFHFMYFNDAELLYHALAEEDITVEELWHTAVKLGMLSFLDDLLDM